jgi:hypothetical protein
MQKVFLQLKSFKLVLLLVFGMILFSNQSSATHLVGSDISYQCTSTPGVYKVTMKIYRDCAGISLCGGCNNAIPNGTVSGCTTASSGWGTQIVGASPGCVGVNFGSFVLTAVSGTSGFDIIQTCTSVFTVCTNCNTRTAGTFSPGIEVYTYEGNVDLSGIPSTCCNVILGANTCCRNDALTTIVPGSFQTVCVVNRCQTPCNSAPTFTNDAAALVCAGVDFVYNLGAIDPDGDSLSYTFGQSLQGIGSFVSYKPPYSAGYPFPYFGAPNQNAAYPAGLRIDPLTGDVMFRPMGVFVANLVIEVTQWKLIGGVYVNVGVTRRDVQFQTRLCLSNKIPVVKAYRNGILQTGLAFTVCAGQQICLDIVAQDQQDLTASPQIVADTTDLKWNNPGLYNPVMASATFVRNYILSQRVTQGPKADSFKFCWTPPVSAARPQPHSFTVTGSDRFCPVKAFATRGINITVIAIPVPAITVVDNKCGFRTFNFTLQNPGQTTLDPTKSKWQIETFPGSGGFTVANASPGVGNPIYRHYFNNPGTYKWRLALNSQQPVPLGCPSLDSGTVTIGIPLDVSVRDTYNCVGSPVTVKAVATGGNRVGNQAGYQFFQGNLASQTVVKGNLDPNVGFGITIDSFLTVTPSNVGNQTMYKVKVRDSDGCLDSTTFNVLTRALPLRELTPKIRLCEGDDTSLFVGNNGSVPVLRSYWYLAPNLTTPIDTQPTYTMNDLKFSDSATYVLRKTDIYGCKTLDTTLLYVNSPVNFISPKDSACQNDPTFALRGRFNTMYIDSFVWYNMGSTTQILENDTLLLPTTTVGTTLYTLRGYQTYDGRTCYKDDTASLKINGLPTITNRPQPVALCSDQGLYNLGSVQTSNPSASQTIQVWSYPPNPNAITSAGNVIRTDSLKNIPGVYVGKAFGNYVYLSVKATTTGCFRRDSVLLGIFPVAPVSITGPPKFCDFDKAYGLYNLTKLFNPSGLDETWTGRGVSYNPLTKRYTFTPTDTNNLDPTTNVRTGLSLATDSNVLKYEFNLAFPPTIQVSFIPARPGIVTMSPPFAGCPSSDTVLFRVTKSPIVRAGIIPTICVGDDSVFLSSRALPGTNSTTAANPATSYWYFAAPNASLGAIARGQVFMPFHPNIVVPNDGQQIYKIIYADVATGCRAADTTDITVKGIPNVSILTSPLSDSAVCLTQDKIIFNLNPDPATLPSIDSISFTGAPNLSASIGASSAFLDIKNNASILEQVYNLRYYYRTSEGCSNSATKAIRVQFPPDVQLSKNGSACEYGGSFTIDVLKTPSSKHPYNLAWSVLNQSGTIISSTNTQFTYSPSAAEKAAGKVTISIITTNNGLCAAASDQSEFIINPKPVADFTGIDSACVRAGIPLNITLTAVPNPVPDCNYIWEIEGVVEIDSLNKTVYNKSFTTPKSYPIKLTVINKTTGCVDTSSIKTSTAWLTPTADFDPDKLETTIAKPYFTFKNKTNPLANNTYLWHLSVDPVTELKRTSTVIDPTDIAFKADTAEIAIKLIAISDKGCIDSVTKYIRINPDITVFIPNVFYPSTNGIIGSGSKLPLSDCVINGIPCNSHFFVQASGFENIEIYIYNRWGKLVYESKDNKETWPKNTGWDGTDMKSGGECQQDAYVYQIFASSFSGKKYQYSGSVTLLR